MKWKEHEMIDVTPRMLAEALSKRLPDGDPRITVKEMLNVMSFNAAQDSFFEQLRYLRGVEV